VSRCGAYKLILTTSYLNEDPDGELGVVQFESFELWLNGHHVLGPVGFATCDVGVGLWEAFGQCPSSYADAVHVQLLGSGRSMVTMKRSFNDKDLNARSVVDEAAFP
jgi:hypothetical protein